MPFMKKLVLLVFLPVINICNVLQAQSVFEGILTTKVSFKGLDLSYLTENIDYQKGNIQTQVTQLLKKAPSEQFS